MFFVFVYFAYSATSADLLPPFYLTSKNYTGSWQFGGQAIVYEEYAILTPPIQFHKGCVWSSLPLPCKDWSVYFHLNISEGTGGGGFGIWLIDKHGADGNFFGGPHFFRGVALIGSVDDENLYLKLIESDGNTTKNHPFNKSSYGPNNYDFKLDISNESLILCLDVFKTQINISYLNNQFDPISIISKNINVSLVKTWLGVTAMNDGKTSKFVILAARFSIYDYFAASQHGRQKPFRIEIESSMINSYDSKNILRNPYFRVMKNEIDGYRKEKGVVPENSTKSSDDLLKILDEFSGVFDEVAQFKHLYNFLKRTVVPYSQDWHRRSFKIIEASKNATKIFSDCFNQTKELIKIFNKTIMATTNKADTKLSDINDELFRNIVKYVEKQQKLSSEVIKNTANQWFSLLKYFAIFEVCAVLVLYLKQR